MSIKEKVPVFLKRMANDPNPLKRGIHRIGIAMGTILALFTLIVGLCFFICFVYYILKYLFGNPDFDGLLWTFLYTILSTLVMPIVFSIPIVSARILGWIVEGFQKTKD